jgi:hypothetical protein
VCFNISNEIINPLDDDLLLVSDIRSLDIKSYYDKYNKHNNIMIRRIFQIRSETLAGRKISHRMRNESLEREDRQILCHQN